MVGGWGSGRLGRDGQFGLLPPYLTVPFQACSQLITVLISFTPPANSIPHTTVGSLIPSTDKVGRCWGVFACIT